MKQGLVQSTGVIAGAVFDHPDIMPAALEQDADAWAILIAARWRASIENIFDTGRMLIAAKAKLPHGEFTAMLETKLPFRPRQSQMLMAIAADARLSNPQYVALLPASWGTVYDLTRVADDQLERGFREQIINPEMERADVERLRPVPARIAQPMSDAEVFADTGEPPGMTGSQNTAEADPDREAGLYGGSPVSAPMPGGGLAIAHSRVEPVDSLDFFPTPPWATRALFEHVLAHLDRKKHCYLQRAWEPACGEGHMAYVLREYFRDVHSTDICDYGHNDDTLDFLEVKAASCDWIITNPPFGDKSEAFVLKALQLAGVGVGMFVRLQWLETIGRYEKIFRQTPPTLISFFAERVPVHKGRWLPDGDTLTAYIWLVWIKGAEPRAPFWIPPGCREALTKADDAKRFGKAFVEGEAA